MIECPVTQCHNGTPNGQVCDRCIRELTLDLRLAEPERNPERAAHHNWWEDSADYWQGIEAELQLTVTRQSSKTPQPGGRATDVAVPYNIAASNAATALILTVRRWVAIVATPEDLGGGTTFDIAACSRILTRHITDLQALAVDELRSAFRVAINSLDARTARIYAGPCPGCGRDLYTHAGGDEAECRSCDEKHDGRQAWRDGKLEAAKQTPMTRKDILVIAPAVYEIAISANLFDVWVHRRRLLPAYRVWLSKEPDTRKPVYLLSDVEALAKAQAAKEEARTVR